MGTDRRPPYRVGRHQERNIYRVTEENPDVWEKDEFIAVALRPELGPYIVEALNQQSIRDQAPPKGCSDENGEFVGATGPVSAASGSTETE